MIRLYAFGCFLSVVLSTNVHAAKMSEQDLVNGIRSQNDISQTEAERVVHALVKANNNFLPQVGGVMFIHGLELTLLWHQGTWQVRHMSVFDDAVKKWIRINRPYYYDIYYQNGGLAASLSYKWLWLFFTQPPKIDDLDGAEYGGPIFGGGLGASIHPGFGFDVEYLHGRNRAGGIWVLGPSLGVGAGLRFPNMVFNKKAISTPTPAPISVPTPTSSQTIQKHL